MSTPISVGISMPLTDTEPPNTALTALESEVRFQFPVVGVYYSFDTDPAGHALSLSGLAGRTLMVCWEPRTTTAIVRLSDIPSRKWDKNIDKMLVGMRAFSGQVVIRFGHEMNGNWFPWSVAYSQANAATAGVSSVEDYINAWRYIVDRERAMPGKSNIKWFWCPNNRDIGGVKLENYFPGLHWVDIGGIDAYNEPGGWQTFDALVNTAYWRVQHLIGHKPFWVGETGCPDPQPGAVYSKTDWFNGMATSTKWEQLQVAVYSNYGSGQRDWTLQDGDLGQVRQSLASTAQQADSPIGTA